MNRWFAGALAICASGLSCGVRAEQTFEMLADEEWRGAATHFGAQMPFDRATSLEIDLRTSNYYNQFSSLLLSNRGRVLWCDVQAKFSFANGVIRVEAEKPAVLTDAGKTLRDAFRFASGTYFPPSGKAPDLAFFAAPQYNTWIELTYNQNEKDILAYAQSMLDNGCPPGVLMIDDTWQAAYGDWTFDGRRSRASRTSCGNRSSEEMRGVGQYWGSWHFGRGVIRTASSQTRRRSWISLTAGSKI